MQVFLFINRLHRERARTIPLLLPLKLSHPVFFQRRLLDPPTAHLGEQGQRARARVIHLPLQHLLPLKVAIHQPPFKPVTRPRLVRVLQTE